MWALLLVITLDMDSTFIPMGIYKTSEECVAAGKKLGPQYPGSKLQCHNPPPAHRLINRISEE